MLQKKKTSIELTIDQSRVLIILGATQATFEASPLLARTGVVVNAGISSYGCKQFVKFPVRVEQASSDEKLIFMEC